MTKLELLRKANKNIIDWSIYYNRICLKETMVYEGISEGYIIAKFNYTSIDGKDKGVAKLHLGVTWVDILKTIPNRMKNVIGRSDYQKYASFVNLLSIVLPRSFYDQYIMLERENNLKELEELKSKLSKEQLDYIKERIENNDKK